MPRPDEPDTLLGWLTDGQPRARYGWSRAVVVATGTQRAGLIPHVTAAFTGRTSHASHRAASAVLAATATLPFEITGREHPDEIAVADLDLVLQVLLGARPVLGTIAHPETSR